MTAIQSFHKTLWLMVIYSKTKFGCKRIFSSEDTAETVTFWLYKPLLWPWPSKLHDTPTCDDAPHYQLLLQKVEQFRRYCPDKTQRWWFQCTWCHNAHHHTLLKLQPTVKRTYSLLRKKPPNIMKGTRMGGAMARARLTSPDSVEINRPAVSHTHIYTPAQCSEQEWEEWHPQWH